jgi:hypothetical protein
MMALKSQHPPDPEKPAKGIVLWMDLSLAVTKRVRRRKNPYVWGFVQFEETRYENCRLYFE